MKNRIKKIKDLRRALAELTLSYNPALWEQDFLKDPSEEIMAQVEAKDAEFEEIKRLNAHVEPRKNEYAKRGLHFDVFIEAMIEDDVDKIAWYRNERQKVKDEIPKQI